MTNEELTTKVVAALNNSTVAINEVKRSVDANTQVIREVKATYINLFTRVLLILLGTLVVFAGAREILKIFPAT